VGPASLGGAFDLESAVDLARAVQARETTATDLVTQALRRLAHCDGRLRAFTGVASAAAVEAASIDARIAAGERVGPLAGVPIGVKGHRGLEAPQCRHLRAAGAVPIGVTSTPRGPGPQTWGYTDRGPTRNPWRPDLSPGGSSAGSAAAVAAGVVPLATGSDGAGSVRIPAAWCGVFGYKPTTALAPGTDRTGLAVPGPLVRDPRDLAAWAGAVLPPLPSTRRPVRAAWSADLGFAAADLDDEVVALARAAADRLVADAGLAWSPGGIVLQDPGPAWTAIRGSRDPAGAGTAAAIHTDNDRRLAVLFASTDLLLTPTTPGPPHGHDGPGERMNVALTWAFNLSGHPAVTVPAGFTRRGAPVGLQLVADLGADHLLLELAQRQPPAPAAPVAMSARSEGARAR
jgi:Asp-tRNA(Asn)/Glu-tRNA(Gln) amidotransferase A subunit family amidase